MELKTIYRRLHLLYFRYKDSPYFSVSLYAVIILVSLLITLLVIIPQIQSWFSLQDEIQQTKDRIKIIRTNSQFLSSLDPVLLDSDYAISATALPPQRDVPLLVGAINAAAAASGVVLADFSFQGGELASQPALNPLDKGITSQISFTAQGNFVQVLELMNQLEKKLPLLSIESIDAQFEQTNASQVSVLYYTKALPLIPNNDTVPLKDITPEARVLLQTLREWQVPVIDFSDPSASYGAVPAPL